MTTRRSYQDACAVAHGLDLVGERWALLVVRELLLGPKRFTDLRASLPGISPNVLTQRLSELEVAAVVQRRKLPPPASAWIYELTAWGLELEPVILAFGRWAAKSPTKPRDVPMGIDSVALSFRASFSPELAQDFSTCIELRLTEHRFTARVDGGAFKITRGEATSPDVVVVTDATSLAGLAYGGQDLEAFKAAGLVDVQGDQPAFERFLTLFPRPALATGAVITP